VETSTGFHPATWVVVTAGVDAPALCAPLGFDLPIAPSPALLMRFTAPPGLVRTLVAAPHTEVREAADGRLLVAADYQGEVDERDLQRVGEQMLRRLVSTFHDADDVRLDSVRLGVRPVPVDGLPIIGPVPGVGGAYVAVMHSGVTLAPAVASLVAAEVVGEVRAPELAGLRPDRFRPPGGG
jgi:glycine/D-amino acid oxidase-like deaminating enzyme